MFIYKSKCSFVTSVFDYNLCNKLYNLKRIDETFITCKRGVRVKCSPRKIVGATVEKHKMSDDKLNKNKLFSKTECGCILGSDRSVVSGSHPSPPGVSEGSNKRAKESIDTRKNVYKSPKCPSSDKQSYSNETRNYFKQNFVYNVQSPCAARSSYFNNVIQLGQPNASVNALYLSNCFVQGISTTSLEASTHFYHRSLSDSTFVRQELNNVCFNSSQRDGNRTGRLASKLNRATSDTRSSNVSRFWKRTPLGKILDKKKNGGKNPGIIFKVMSYNVLAQDLLLDHSELYRENDEKALSWKHRWRILFKEIKEHDCDILCLQEVQFDHIGNYYSILELLGYVSIYKQRTGIRTDGCAIYYKKNVFHLIEHIDVEYNQPNVSLLDRDNVAIIAKFAPKNNPSAEFVVATTHLLYNPKRLDIRLVQTQVLLTEVERIAFKGRRNDSKEYLPVIITGDLNATPDTVLYEFVKNGYVKYEGKVLRKNHAPTGKVLLPSSLCITDSSQHANLIKHRQNTNKISRSKELKLIRLKNSQQSEPSLEMGSSCDKGLFSTGTLSHPFKLTSVYSHIINNDTEGSTFQHEWITVDYIFYSGILDETRKFRDEKLKLLSHYTLPTSQQLTFVRIPNLELGSDHLALIAQFKLEY